MDALDNAIGDAKDDKLANVNIEILELVLLAKLKQNSR